VSDKIVPVILSGGSGTRLWPLSRTQRPKQLLSLTHPETMLQLTARRVSDTERFARPIVVANAVHADLIEQQLAEVEIAVSSLILEPLARNTAPAIALAALSVEPDALLLVMPSDHVIGDVRAFEAAIAAAAPLVRDGWLATFGISPELPETGYGYIQLGEQLGAGVHRAQRFVEKPDLATARSYLASGDYVWNGGIFLFRADAYLAALELHSPQMVTAARDAMAAARREGTRIYPERAAFANSPSDSIDYAVMEKAERVIVTPVAMGWSDVGSWDALHDLADKDEHGNHGHGEVLAIDTVNCLIRTEGPLVAAVGVKDLIVIATGDAVLILPRGSSQDVKRAVDALRKQGHVSLDWPC
jgi:mannose-1-phosphate guanylyltransferase/mannose-1-phosphate guanylyltransferase/mannose-6-phosphate isomerase